MYKYVDLNERDEILKNGAVLEQSDIKIYNHINTTYLIAYRGRAFILNKINDKIGYFIEVLPDEHRGD